MFIKMILKKYALNKKGISPVIATVLLIAMVMVIALIVFMYMWNFVEEENLKFDKNIQLVCEDVKFSASYSETGTLLQISNDGNVPIYNMQVKIFKDKEHDTIDAVSWPENGLNPGEGYAESQGTTYFSGATKLILMPVLRGETSSGKQEFECGEKYGEEIVI